MNQIKFLAIVVKNYHIDPDLLVEAVLIHVLGNEKCSTITIL